MSNSTIRWYVGVIVLLAFIVVAVPMVRYQIRRHTFNRLQDEALSAITSMKRHRPKHVPQQGWNSLVDSLYAAVLNACFSPDDTPLDAFAKYNAELRQRIADNPKLDLEFSRSVLVRMGEISPAAKRHIRKVVVLHDELLAPMAIEAWKQECEALPEDASVEDYRRSTNYRVLTQMRGYYFSDVFPDDYPIAMIAHRLCPESADGSDNSRFPWHLYFEDVLGEEPVSHISPDDWPARKQAWCEHFAAADATGLKLK